MPVMRTRFMWVSLRGKPSRLAVRRPLRVELAEELDAALLLVAFADRAHRHAQPVEGAQEPLVRRMAPPDVARAAPARLAQPVEAPVVADAEVRVGLDVVAGELAEPGPRVEETERARHHLGHRVAAGVGAASTGVGEGDAPL